MERERGASTSPSPNKQVWLLQRRAALEVALLLVRYPVLCTLPVPRLGPPSSIQYGLRYIPSHKRMKSLQGQVLGQAACTQSAKNGRKTS